MLTPRQLECYNAMRDFSENNGYMPSYEQLREILGVHGKSAIHGMIVRMEQRGAIERLPYKSRAIRLLPLN